ncbi:hypothetical protein J6590_074080, partial [Homalodisca vitripennis]
MEQYIYILPIGGRLLLIYLHDLHCTVVRPAEGECFELTLMISTPPLWERRTSAPRGCCDNTRLGNVKSLELFKFTIIIYSYRALPVGNCKSATGHGHTHGTLTDAGYSCIRLTKPTQL